ELLFTTHLSDREIVLGKLFGRLTHLGGVLLAGLPVLCILELWGGIGPVVIVAGFAVTALTLLSVGSVCILISVFTRHSLKALVISYAILLPIALGLLPLPGCFFSSPLAFMLGLERELGMGTLHEVILLPGFRGSAAPATSPLTSHRLLALVLPYA